MAAPEFYLRFFLMTVWMALAFLIGIVHALVRWGNPNVNQATSRLYGRGVLWLGKIRLELENFDQLEANQPCVYVANHQGALDIATCGAIYPHNCVVVGKKEIVWIPFMGLYFVAAGNIRVDRQKRTSAVQSLSRVIKAIGERKVSVWIFPEGTRNKTADLMLPFKKGAFHVAIEAQVPVVPVVVAPIHPLLSWKDRRMIGGVLKIKLLPPVPTRGLTTKDVDSLIKGVRDDMLATYKKMGEEQGLKKLGV